MTKIIAYIALCLAILLSACGGGGGGNSEAPSRAIELWGDSMAEGSYFNATFTAAYKLDRPMAAQMRTLLPGWTVNDHSYGGETPGEALGLDNPRAEAPRFEPVPGTIPVVRFGTAAAAGGQALNLFEQRLEQFVQVSGPSTVLVGVDSRFPTYDAVVERVAVHNKLRYVDIKAVPIVASPDGLHVDQATSDAVAKIVADAVLEAL